LVSYSSLIKIKSLAKQVITTFTPDQLALIELAKEAKRRGMALADADVFMEWRREYAVEHILNHINTTHWVWGSHIRIDPINHIPVR